MGNRWQNKRKKEHFYKKAKKEGYRSRAAYKLQQLDEKFGILSSEDVVVDLGAAPGGWLQVAREKIGENGFILGIDLDEIEEVDYRNVKIIQNDITDKEITSLILENIPQKPNVILSDASPDITGIWDVDHARSIELSRTALKIARKLLKLGGNVLIKVFQGEFFEDLVKDVKKSFKFQKSSKPKASRKQSAEIYIIGKNFSPD